MHQQMKNGAHGLEQNENGINVAEVFFRKNALKIANKNKFRELIWWWSEQLLLNIFVIMDVSEELENKC